MAAATRIPRIFKRFSSTISIKDTPSKAHHHVVIPSSSFPSGYLLTGIHCGIKKKTGAHDLAVIISTSEHPTSAAACFTRNVFKAAPVVVSEEVLKKSAGRARAVVVNSGCANAVTGKQGLEDAWSMVRETDALLPPPPSSGAKIDETLVMSTGVIGQPLPITKIISGIRSQSTSVQGNTLASDFAAWERAAKAFMTTDTFPKLRSRSFTVNGTTYRLAGMDKGAGMIHPDMGPPSTSGQLHATLLGCILTDAAISPRSLQTALTYAVERSFNSISVDGDMSTNDTIVVLANGAAAGEEAVEIDEETDKEGYEVFKRELTDFAVDLAKLVARDGEGATKFVTVSVKVSSKRMCSSNFLSMILFVLQGASNYEDAHKIASRISTSALVKTALYGEDAK